MRSLKDTLLASTVLALATAVALPAAAQTDPETAARIEALESKIQDLENKLGTKVEELEKKQADSLDIKLNPDLSVSTADKRYTFETQGRIHWDVGSYSHDDDLAAFGIRDANSGNNFRRARLGIRGVIDYDWQYEFQLDLGGSVDGTASLNRARLTYNGFKPVSITAGFFKPTFTMEDSTSSNDIMFIERSPIVNNAVAIGGGTRTGIEIKGTGDFFGAKLALTGDTVGTVGNDEQTGINGRVWVTPLNDSGEMGSQVVHLGGYASHVFEFTQGAPASNNGVRLGDRAGFRVDPNFRPNRTRATPALESATVYGIEAAGQLGPIFVQGEYIRLGLNGDSFVNQKDLDYDGYYIQGSYILTGEGRRYSKSGGTFGRPRPDNPFSLSKGGMGAWEILFRYAHEDLVDGDPLRDGAEMDLYTVGLNWFVNSNVMFKFNWIRGKVEDTGGGRTGVVGTDADFDIFGARMQVNW